MKNLTPEQKEALARLIYTASQERKEVRAHWFETHLSEIGLALVPVSESGGWISVEERLPEEGAKPEAKAKR